MFAGYSTRPLSLRTEALPEMQNGAQGRPYTVASYRSGTRLKLQDAKATELDPVLKVGAAVAG